MIWASLLQGDSSCSPIKPCGGGLRFITLLFLSLATLAPLITPQTSTAAEDRPTAVNISGTAGNYLISIEHESGNTTAYKGDIYKVAGTSLQNNKFIPIPTDPGVLIGLKSGSISTSNPIFQPLTGTGYEAKSVATVGSNPNSEFIFTIVTVMLKNPSTGNPGTSTDPVHLNVGAMHGASVDYSKSGVFVTISRANGAVETDLVMLPAHGSYCVNSFPYIISGNNVCLTSGSMDHKPATTLSTKLSDMKDIPGVKISDQYTTTSSNLDMGTGYQLEHASLGYMTDMIFAIKNKPATMGTVVAQMPTTGAPTGNMEADLMGTIISLLGGLVMLIRRRLS